MHHPLEVVEITLIQKHVVQCGAAHQEYAKKLIQPECFQWIYLELGSTLSEYPIDKLISFFDLLVKRYLNLINWYSIIKLCFYDAFYLCNFGIYHLYRIDSIKVHCWRCGVLILSK